LSLLFFSSSLLLLFDLISFVFFIISSSFSSFSSIFSIFLSSISSFSGEFFLQILNKFFNIEFICFFSFGFSSISLHSLFFFSK
jgi:hypothetical protein